MSSTREVLNAIFFSYKEVFAQFLVGWKTKNSSENQKQFGKPKTVRFILLILIISFSLFLDWLCLYGYKFSSPHSVL
ncbi:hypothetical protein A7K93_07680 [Candidatus Methylacidiphilum fumarolicum]|nr:hypothetical protein A7K73_05940 [Candidatus Methylacidiphilum fumarolicum]TFE72837.1 hypothetical protein A7K93_07680 [Candidatus Methylacidiphilum fumarolicum]TFE74581.1 hypothetical protein A7K72_03610 [Candidatus Methylacidiphilum fumarolicum]TFE77144.1 hypothetical protein A7D33_06135 [Candidatus Methylacidiphilum fumarolicum]